MDAEQADAIEASLCDATYNELVAAMIKSQEAHKALKEQTSEAWDKVILIVRKIIPNRMDADQIQNITVILPDDSKKQLLIIDSCSVKTPENNKSALWAWLRKHDAEHMITETVNASSLGGYVREQMRLGEPYPNDICIISTYTTASLRKVA